MPGLKLFTSNRLEALAGELSETLRLPLAEPLTPEVILVQSHGMERWLSLVLARRMGICANIR
jgi:exodeoxyribonuclease V gamma subunit